MPLRHFAGRSYLKHRLTINITPGFYIYLSIMLLLLPLPWLCAALLAGLLHELGHIAAIYAVGGAISHITLRGAGASIQTCPMDPGQELVCAAAGPAAGALLILLFPVLPKLAFCGLLQTVFNLLPVCMFDGSRIVRSISVLMFGEKNGGRVFYYFNRICMGLLAFGCALLIRFSIVLSILGLLCLFSSIKNVNDRF